MNRNIVLLLAEAFLSACSNTSSNVESPKKLTQAPTTTSSATAQSDVIELANEQETKQGRLVIYREGIIGLAPVPKININGNRYGKFPAASYFSCDVPAGTYEIETKTENTANLTVEVQAGEIKYVRTFITFGLAIGRVHLENSTTQDGIRKTSKLKQTNPTCGATKVN